MFRTSSIHMIYNADSNVEFNRANDLAESGVIQWTNGSKHWPVSNL